MRAIEIAAVLQDFYDRQEWIFFHELRIGTGYGKDADQRIDAFAMHPWPSKQFRRVAYEIKVSRSDFLAELRRPRKRNHAMLLSNEFYFATPPGLIRPGELPPEAGLAEIHPNHIHFSVAAPWRDTIPPTWRFVAALVRRAQRDGNKKIVVPRVTQTITFPELDMEIIQ